MLEDGRIVVLPNHTDDSSDVEFAEEDMMEGEDAGVEIEDINGSMDLYE